MSQQFTRGQKSPLSALTAGTDLYVGVHLTGGGSWDISCFGLDANDRLSDDRYFIFFNQPKSPEGSISKLGAQSGDTESFRLTLNDVPSNIDKLSFCAALESTGTAAGISAGYLRIVVGGEEVVRYPFSGADFGTERAVIIGDVYRKSGVWRFAAVGQGFAGGLADLIKSYGGEVDDEPAAAPPAAAPAFAPPPAPPAAPPAFAPPPVPPAAPPAAAFATPPAAPAPSAQPPVAAPAAGAWAPEPLPSQAAPVQPGAMVSLQKYRETATTGRWTQQNKRLVKLTLGAEAHARRGSMVAYQGNVEFDYKGSGGIRAMIEGKVTGQKLELMTCKGEGEVFLAENANDLHIVDLQGQSLCVSVENVLAFDATVQSQIQRIESAGIPGGGKFHLVLSGQGTVVVMTKGTPVTLPVQGPTYADMNALVAWTHGMRVSVNTQVRVSRQIYGGASGESFALQFMGLQGHFVVVQPYEV